MAESGDGSGGGIAAAPVAKTGSIKVHLPNNGFNIVKFIDNINIKVNNLTHAEYIILHLRIVKIVPVEGRVRVAPKVLL